MKIVYIGLKGMPLGGGIEKYTEEIGSRMAERGHDIIVYTMKHYGTVNGIYKGMKIRTVPTLRRRSFEKIVSTFLATVKHCLEDKKTDIVHYHAFGPAMFNFIPRFLGRKVVVQGHGIEWMRSKWGILAKFFLKITEYPSVKFPHAITVVSKVQQEYLRRKYKRESIVIPTGVNVPEVYQPELIKKYGLEGNDYILFVGRLVREKGAHYLIEAFKRIRTNLKLVIAGDALYEEDYKKELYHITKTNKNIIFTGFATGRLLYELFSNAYLFVLPSEVEGLPTILLEAMSYGKLCLVSDIPENLEALNGFGYSFRNKKIDDLADKLNNIVNGSIDIELTKRARTYILENYSWDSIANNFEKLYEKLLGGEIYNEN